MRDNYWLAQLLQNIHRDYFADVPIENTILVRFGRQSRTRFGSIVARKKKGYSRPVTYISINALFRDEVVPEYVIAATLLHEFVHYAHGFHSPLKRQYRYPHKGGIVNQEIWARGGGALLEQQTTWIKQQYKPFLRSQGLL